MTASNFEDCLALTLAQEGGYADHPRDPGGATNLGITRATLAAARGRPVTKAEVACLTRVEAAAIYRKNYWNAVRGDGLPSGLDAVLFDHAVNSGSGTAIRMLQRALGIAADGRMGASTLRAAATADPREMISQLCRARLASLARLKTFSTFGKGWTRRIAEIERRALALVERDRAQSRVPAAARPAALIEESLMSATAATIDSKPFWASQTIWSSIAVIGSSVAGALLAWRSNDMASFGASLTALLGGVNAIVGRYRGTTPIA
jgi:lysozyme family protein